VVQSLELTLAQLAGLAGQQSAEASAALLLRQAQAITALYWHEERPDLDYTRILGVGRPTRVTRGICDGFSLPVYAADQEELFFNICVPDRYDEASDIIVHIHCYIDTANTNKNFQLRLEWEHHSDGDLVPVIFNTVTVETPTGAAAQFMSFHVEFTIDYDIDGADVIAGDDELDLRLYRIAASADEIAGEVVVSHLGVEFRCDKIGRWP